MIVSQLTGTDDAVANSGDRAALPETEVVVRTWAAGPRRRSVRLHPAVVVVAAVCAVLVRQAMRSGLAGDVFYEVAAGRWMLANHAIARHDMLTYTISGRAWTDEEWGFQLLLAWLVAHVGAVSYWLVSAVPCCGALLLSVARWRTARPGWTWTAALSVLAGAGMYQLVTPRPQDLSYLFFSAVLLLVTLARKRTVWLFAVPPLLLIWANLHGSFLLGLGVVLLEFVWSVLPAFRGRFMVPPKIPARAMAMTLVAGLVATLVNPNGPGLLSYSLHVSSSSQLTALIAEWQSPNFHSLFLLTVIIGPVLFLVGLLAFTETTFAFDDVVIACAMLLATLHAARFMPYFVLAMCSVLSWWAPIKKETIRPNVVTLPVAVLAVAVFLAGAHPAAGSPMRSSTSMGTPVAATRYLLEQRGRVFTTYWWDDYLDYVGIPVFVDGRTDLYFGTDVLRTYVNVQNLTVYPDAVFQRWDVRWVMWDKGDSLAVYLSHDPAWRLAFSAGDAMVFEHVGAW